VAAYPRRETVRQGCAFAANRATFWLAVRDIAAQFKEFARTAPGRGDGLLHVATDLRTNII